MTVVIYNDTSRHACFARKASTAATPFAASPRPLAIGIESARTRQNASKSAAENSRKSIRWLPTARGDELFRIADPAALRPILAPSALNRLAPARSNKE